MMFHRIAFSVLLGFCCAAASASSSGVDSAQLDRARNELRRALREETKFVKVHAAEALLELGIGQDVRSVFESEQALHVNESPYHIGIWRVLARTSKSDAERKTYVDKIVAAYAAGKQPDAENAVETLAKLQYAVPEHDRPALKEWTEAVPDSRRAFGRWLLAVSGNADDVRHLAELLKDDDAETRAAAAYGLRFVKDKVPDDVIPLLEAAADSIRPQDQAGHIIGNAVVFTKSPARAEAYRQQLIPVAKSGAKAEKFEALNCFAERGDARDVPTLIELLNDPEGDVRINASRALLKIDERLRKQGR
jgi:SSS family solute:Na+ symporter